MKQDYNIIATSTDTDVYTIRQVLHLMYSNNSPQPSISLVCIWWGKHYCSCRELMGRVLALQLLIFFYLAKKMLEFQDINNKLDFVAYNFVLGIMVLVVTNTLHSNSLGSGSHSSFSTHVDKLGPVSIAPVGQVNVIFSPSNAGSS